MKKRKFHKIKLPTDRPEEKYKQILDFCLLIKNFFPKEIITVNNHDYYKVLIGTLQAEEGQIMNLLIHHLAKLYQSHRIIRNKRIIEIAEEDILTALEMTGTMLNPKAFLTQIQRHHFVQLELTFQARIFTTQEARKALQLSKTHTQRMLLLLVEHRLLERLRSKNGQLNQYQISKKRFR